MLGRKIARHGIAITATALPAVAADGWHGWRGGPSFGFGVTVGAPAYGVGDAVDDVGAALERVGPLATGDAVLVKASRAAGLDRLAHALTDSSSDRAGAA